MTGSPTNCERRDDPDTPDRVGRSARGPINNVRGALFMLGGMFVFAAVDAKAKYLTDHLPVLQIVWLRQIGLVIGVLVLIAYHGRGILTTGFRTLQIARGVAAAGSATLFIIGLNFVHDTLASKGIAPARAIDKDLEVTDLILKPEAE